MLNFLKTTFTETTEQEIAQAKFIQDSCTYHGRRATNYSQAYLVDRLWKQNYILVNVIAEGYDQKRFLEAMVKAKSKPSSLT